MGEFQSHPAGIVVLGGPGSQVIRIGSVGAGNCQFDYQILSENAFHITFVWKTSDA